MMPAARLSSHLPRGSAVLSRTIASLLLLCAFASPAAATTARDLSARIRVDGSTAEYTDDEKMFGANPLTGALEEAVDDSKWGVNEDLNQIRVSWDAENLYLAGEGRIWDNNMILLIDSVPTRGLDKLTDLNSWRRNFVFDTTGASAGEGFAPDLFGATWDGNTNPRLIVQQTGYQVADNQVGPLFRAAATFFHGEVDRAMEIAIPWSVVFLKSSGLGTSDTTISIGGSDQAIHRFPPGTKIRIAGVITAGADGTGGPDSAPDNLRGHSDNSGEQVLIDNWAIVDLDQNDDTGLGAGGPDGVADWNVQPKDRITFKYQPPIAPLRFALTDLVVDPPAFAPDLGGRMNFRFSLTPRLNPADPVDQSRRFNLTANVYDLRGRWVRNVFVSDERFALDPLKPDKDFWDGRDANGERVPPGVYVLRTVIEPNLSRATRSVVVVR